MYSIVIQPSFEIGYEVLIIDEEKMEIVEKGISFEYDILTLLKSIIEKIEERNKKNE